MHMHACMHSKNRDVAVTKSMLFQLNVGHKMLLHVSYLQMLFTITSKIYWSLGSIGNTRNSIRASPYVLTVLSCNKTLHGHNNIPLLGWLVLTNSKCAWTESTYFMYF